MSSAPTPMITPDNCPRDEAGLKLLSRVVRYRLALNLGLFANETPAESAFAAADDQVQVTTLLTALQARDAQMNGHQYTPPPSQPMVPAPMTPQPLAVAPAPVPGGYGAPQPMTPQPMQPMAPQGQPQYAPPPPMQPMAAPMPPAYTPPPPAAPPAMPPTHQAAPPQPQYAPPPAPQAYVPPPPMAAPPGVPAPMGPPPGVPQYAPPPGVPQQQQAYAPQQPQYAPPAPQPQQQAPMMRQPSTMGDPANVGAVPSQGKLADIEATMLGMARTQNMLFNLVLDLAQHIMGLDKQTIALRLIQHAQQGEPMRFFEAGVQQGKVG